MRDMRRIRERETVQLDRGSLLWLTFGALVILGSTFALGFLVGQRAEKISMNIQGTDEPLERLKMETERHRELTFYSDLTKKESNKKKAKAPEPPVRVKPREEIQSPQTQLESITDKRVKSKVRVALDTGPARSGDYTIQVSSFQTMEEAKAYASSLERKGFRPFIVAAEIRKKGTWYRVRLGRFSDEATAQAGKRILLDADIPAWVLRTE